MLLERIAEVARRWPDRIAHRGDGPPLSYGELARRSDALAACLGSSLVDHSPVAVLGHKEPEMLIGFLGAAKAGHPYVPIDCSLPAERVDRIVAASGTRLVLTPERIRVLAEGAAGAPARCASPADPVYVMYTSGSTGEPKGVVISRASLSFFVDWMLAEQRFGEGETFLDQAPFSFDLSVMDVFPALVTGGTIASITRREVADPPSLLASLARSGITTWVSTPSFARMCLADRAFGRDLLPEVRRFLFCGETLSPEVAQSLRDRFPGAEVWNTYGPTEATVATTSIRIDEEVLARGAPLPVGRPAPGVEVVAVRPDGRTAAAGERGELVIAGPNVAAGYLHRPDLTAAAFGRRGAQPSYRTGDLGRCLDGLVYCDGRLDDQVKVNGFRIELGDVEANLRALQGVRDAVAARIEPPERLVAWVIPVHRPSDPRLASRDLRARLAECLPPYMIPSRIYFVDAFPQTPNGKVDRRRLIGRTAAGAPAR